MSLGKFLALLPLLGERVSDSDTASISEEEESPGEYALQELAAQVETLQQTIKSIENEAEKQHLAKVRAEELARRRGELLDNAHKEANVLVEEKHKLLAQIYVLQKLEDPINDNEAKRTMRRLYQNLEKWAMRHFSKARTADATSGSRRVDQKSSEDVNYVSATYDIQGLIHSEVLDGVFRWVLAPFMVGFQNYLPEHSLRDLDDHIHLSSPNYIWQHWRLAMSEAAASAAVQHQYWDGVCDHIVHSVERKFSKFSKTDRDKRTTQLRTFIRDCYEFKKQLERQEHAYHLWCNPRGVPYNQQNMYSLTSEESTGQLVEVSLWPGLFKIVGPQQWEVVEREVVRTVPACSAPRKSIHANTEQNMALLSEMCSGMGSDGK